MGHYIINEEKNILNNDYNKWLTEHPKTTEVDKNAEITLLQEKFNEDMKNFSAKYDVEHGSELVNANTAYKKATETIDQEFIKIYNDKHFQTVEDSDAETNLIIDINYFISLLVDFKNKDIPNHLFDFIIYKLQTKQFNSIYMCIPGMTLILMFTHCFQILTHVPLKRQLYDLVNFGFIYNSLISMVSNKYDSYVIVGQVVWSLLMLCVNIPSIFNFMISTSNAKLISTIGIVYGLYITIFVGIYMFHRATSTTRNNTSHIIIYQKSNTDSVYDSVSSTSTNTSNDSDNETSEAEAETHVSEQSESLSSSVESSKKDD